MTPDERVVSRVARFNQRLLEGLGHPAYAWHFSENLFIREMRTRTDSGVHLLSPEYRVRKMCPTLDHQWVLCRHVGSHVMGKLGDNHKDNQWILRAESGSGVIPCGGRGGYVATRKYHSPTLEDTLAVISTITLDREKTGQEKLDDTLSLQDRKHNSERDNFALAAVEGFRPSGWVKSGSDHPWESMSGVKPFQQDTGIYDAQGNIVTPITPTKPKEIYCV